jgi:dTDP-4-amino-4,6-dideoxygalactose transaminase
MQAQGITSGIYYSLPLDQVEPYRYLGYGAESFPKPERGAQEALAIALYADMTREHVEAVPSAVALSLRMINASGALGV